MLRRRRRLEDKSRTPRTSSNNVEASPATLSPMTLSLSLSWVVSQLLLSLSCPSIFIRRFALELVPFLGTDDDLPPSHQNRFQRGGSMVNQIHHIEQEAYCSVFRAFKAQSDAVTWDKESLITELRKELRVSDEEHRELLSRVNADVTIHGIREWRKASGLQPGMVSAPLPVHDPILSPTSIWILTKTCSLLQMSLEGPKRLIKGSAGAFGTAEAAEGVAFDPLIGRKVWARWPEDDCFYEAVITDYNEGRNALVYDINTADETWEWVNLNEFLYFVMMMMILKNSPLPWRGNLRRLCCCC
ncbi:hypothetical protein TIFTF001_001348 [Ficus carica]|uniref:ENT domain-containing protein n=1 Tax=Ficus carica TaxID=3494 RepID=A0AA88CQY7_FICCA|nr:hypothetical protein TIFTF001_001348 [Ficus carica]